MVSLPVGQGQVYSEHSGMDCPNCTIRFSAIFDFTILMQDIAGLPSCLDQNNSKTKQQTRPVRVTTHVIPGSGGWGWGQQSKVIVSLRPAYWDSGDFRQKEGEVGRKKQLRHRGAQACKRIEEHA